MTQSDAGRPPYKRPIGDASECDQTLFATQESVEAAWHVVDNVLDDRTPAYDYEPGAGPAASRPAARSG